MRLAQMVNGLNSDAPALSFTPESPGETELIGERIGRALTAGDVILLQGELGAGKTCMTQGIARGLGIDEQVCSPTFVLVGEYSGRLPLYHADLYRLDNPNEVADLDLSQASMGGVLVVEWPERALEWLPSEHLLIQIAHGGGDSRRISMRASGASGERLVKSLGRESFENEAGTAPQFSDR
jgi:tRNA threonylcarbamoyladenosine biosynthesis protein TsaE